MKLIYAGQGMSELPYTSLLFNCTRNQKCQRAFYVPVEQMSDIVLYADLPGEPTLIEIEVMNVCDIANVGSAVSSQYVVGTKHDGTWYGVFGSLIVTPPLGVTYQKFFFKLSLTIDGLVHVYYSEQYEIPYCGTIMFIRGCYPNEEVGTEAVDCNGIYYGFPNNEGFLGSNIYRYIHSAYLRDASIIEQNNKMTFTPFNNKRVYKSVFNREWLLESELVPTFYKDVLIGVFNRGNVQIEAVEWKLADTQDISVVSIDSKLWKLDMILDEECKQNFGCKPADCVLPPVPPVPCNLPDPPFTVTITETEEEGVWAVDIGPGVASLGTFLEWEIYDGDSALVDSGDTDDANTDPNVFWLDTISPDLSCYNIRWRVRCGVEGSYTYSDWTEPFQFGNCVEPSEQYFYLCERFLCSYCPEPFDVVSLWSYNPALTLFKYYKQAETPSSVTVRPISATLDPALGHIIGIARDTCVQSCDDPPPPPPIDP